ncbi:FG-GAP-like repeat-containing protein [Streptomyces sp. NPDC052000]|uniref:FG-GAP-like repeat-containing protein n=1 Tax=Streptomyces sp. NPDC052000 TaxID=3155676 RepID=UPI00344DE443
MTLKQRRAQVVGDEKRGGAASFPSGPPTKATALAGEQVRKTRRQARGVGKDSAAAASGAVWGVPDDARVIGPDGSIRAISNRLGPAAVDFSGQVFMGETLTLSTGMMNSDSKLNDASQYVDVPHQVKVTWEVSCGKTTEIDPGLVVTAPSSLYRVYNNAPVPYASTTVTITPALCPNSTDLFTVLAIGQVLDPSVGDGKGSVALVTSFTRPISDSETYGCAADCSETSFAQPQAVRNGTVNTATGAFSMSASDLVQATPGGGWSATRSYSSNNAPVGASVTSAGAGSLGTGWNVPWETRLQANTATGDVTLISTSGSSHLYTSQGGGAFATPSTSRSALQRLADGTYSLTTPTKRVLTFNDAGRLTSDKDRSGQGQTYSYTDGRVSAVSGAAGTIATLTYTNGLLTQIARSDGRHADYAYSGGRLTSVSSGGKTTTYDYDASSRLNSVKDGNGQIQVRSVYDAQGRVSSQSDATGAVTSYAYHSGETDTTMPDGGVWTDVYSNNHLLSQYDPFGNRTVFTYDKKSNVSRVTDPTGNVQTYAYDSDGHLTLATAPTGTTSYAYDTNGNLAAVTDANNQKTAYGYAAGNLLKSATDPLGNATTFTYTSSGQMASATSPLGAVSQAAYDPAGNRVSTTSPLGTKTTSTFSPSGLPLTLTDPRGNESGANTASFTTTYTYDGGDRVLSSTDPQGGKTLYGYDDAGNLTTVTDPAGKVTAYSYDAANRLTQTKDPAGNVSTVAYDVMGRVASRTDAAGAKTTYTYDKAGRVLTMTSPRGNVAGAKAADFTWTYGYDKVGNQTTATDPTGRTTTTAYDAENRPVSVTDPLGQVTKTKYDGAGNVVETTDAMGKVTTNAYDANNRLTAVKDPNGNTVSYGYDADGNRISETTPLGFKTTYGYDANGRLTTRVEPRGNVAGADPGQFTWKTAYDAAGNRTSETDPLGNKTTYSSDALNNPVERTDPLGRKTTYAYDSVGNLSKVTAPDAGVTSYGYDALGNQTSRTDANQHTTAFAYDPVGRLVKATDPLARVHSYSYDAEGNPATVTNARGQTVTNTFDFRGQVTKSTASDGTPTVSLNYDALGRPAQISDGTGSRSFTYDPAGRLTAVTPGSGGGAFAYSYDAAGRMTERSAPAQRQALDWSAAARTVAGDLNGDGITDIVRIDSKNGLQSFLGSKDSVFTPAAQQSGSGSGFSQVFTGDYTGDGQLDLVAVDKTTGHLLRYTGDGKGGFAAPADLGGGWGALSLTAGDFNGDGKPDFLVLDSSANALYFYPGKGDGTFGDRINLGGGWNTYRLTALDFNKDGKTDLLTVNSADSHLYFYPGKGNGAFGDRVDLGGGWGSMYFTPGDFNGDGKADLLANDTTSHKLRFYPGTGTGAFGDYIAQDDDWTPYGQPIAGQFDGDNALDAIATDSTGHLQTWHGNGAGKLTNRTPAATLTSTKTTYTYDNDGRPSTQTTNGATLTYAYDPAGNLTGTTLPAGNGHIESRSYDQAGRLTQIGSARTTSPLAGRPLKGAALGGTVLNNWQATLNPAGQPTRIDASRAGQSDISRYYSYDTTGRLQAECAAAAKADTCPKTDPDTAYTYDKVGNRLTRTSGGTSTTYAYDAADQLTGTTTPGKAGQSFGYDADGNQTSSGADTLTYDAANRVTRVKSGTDTLDYAYDADGNRTAAAVNGIQRRTTYWDINNPLPQIAAETDGIQVAGYTYNPLGQIQTSQQGTGAFYYHHDQLGSVTDLTDAAGTNQYRYTYDAFGGLTTDKLTASPPSNPFTYTGQYKEPTTDTLGYNLRARNYAPDQGRFTSRDPETQSPLDPYAADYGYADNQPTSLTDPSGRCPVCVSAGIGAVFGAVIDGGVYSWQHRNGDFSWGDFGRAAGRGAIIGGISGALLPGTGNLAARTLGLTGGRALATSAVVNGAVGAGISWGINQATCRPTTPWDLLLGAAGGGLAPLSGPAFRALKGAAAARFGIASEGNLISGLLYGGRPGTKLPGYEGAPIPGRPTFTELENLTVKYGVEFAVTYKYGPGTNGGGGQYYLHAGGGSHVRFPLEPDRMLITHTHPGGAHTPSDADRRILANLERMGSPQRVSGITPVGGSGKNEPFDKETSAPWIFKPWRH